MFKLTTSLLKARSLSFGLAFRFALPKHEVLSMPALSPTMKEGKIVKWLKKAGDKVEAGDAIAEIETDKATMAFEVQEKGYIAKTITNEDFIPLGSPVVVIAKKADDVSQFKDYVFGSSEQAASDLSIANSSQPPAQEAPKAPAQPSAKSYPAHSFLQMPAVSPTMTEGKILTWKVQPGDSFGVGDALFSIETDKATVDYEATEKGYLAKVIVNTNEAFPVGKNVAVIVKNKDSVSQFSDFVEGAAQPASTPVAPQTTSSPQQEQALKQQQQSQPRTSGERVFASPLAKNIASSKGIDLHNVSGSGPGGRILKQDVEGYVPPVAAKQEVKVEQQVKKEQVKKEQVKKEQVKKEQVKKEQVKKEQVKKEQVKKEQVKKEQVKKEQVKKEVKPAKKGFVVPENPYEDIALSSMRKTIANRLSESKQTIPHYYITSSIEMGATNVLRGELNKNEKENGVKISVNDIIIKAMALALRDYPNVNVQWLNNSVRKFKYSDVSVAVAIDGGLITPIVYRAETLGLLDIARRTKDIAKRAREGKLDPSEYVGGTSTVSNLGMFGINTVTSIINPPQATILGIGKTQKRLLVAAEGSNLPYRVAQVMDIIASVDHRAVDGALAAQWLNRIKHYLENPTHMLL